LTSNCQSFELVKEYFGLLEGVISVKGSQYEEFITVEAPVAIWEKVLETVFFTVGMKHGADKITVKNNRMAVRTLQYKLPKVLRGHVSTVLNTVQAPLFRKDKKVKNFESLEKDVLNRVKQNSEKKEIDMTADNIRENNRDMEVTNSESSKTSTEVSKMGRRDYFLGLTYPNLLNDVYNIKSNTGETSDLRF
jgi:hypothetical protein